MMLLALPQPGPRLRLSRPGGNGLQLEHRAQAQTEQARAADPQDIAPGDPQLRIAQVFARLSGYDDHRVAPCVPRGAVANPLCPPLVCQTNIVSCRNGFVLRKMPPFSEESENRH